MCNRRFCHLLKFVCLATLTLGTCLASASLPAFSNSPAQASEPPELVQRGVDAYQAGHFGEAIALWQTALESYAVDTAPNNRAIVLQNLAHAHHQTGHLPEALDYWQQAAALHQTTQNWEKIAQVLVEQAQVYVYLGQPREAIALLCGELGADLCLPGSAMDLAQTTGDRRTQVAALGSLGEAYRVLQDFDRAIEYGKNQGVAIAESLEDPRLLASLHRSVGNAYNQKAREGYLQANVTAQRRAFKSAQRFYDAAWQQDQLAQKHLQQSLPLFREVGDIEGEVKALIGLLELLARPGMTPGALEVSQQASALWEALPANQAKVSIAIRLTKRPQPLVASGGPTGKPITKRSSQSSRSLCQDIIISDQSQRLLEASVELASALQSTRLQSFALGELGHLYECRGNYTQALTYTQQARLAANDAFLALDGLHLWQWQAGRLYQKLGQPSQAITAYEQATATLAIIRSQILATTRNLQFDFRDAVTPVYRELAALQFSKIPPSQLINSQSTLGQEFSKALGNIDALQLAELQNYFGSDCLVPVASKRLDEVPTLEVSGRSTTSPLGQSTALLNTAILPDKTAVTLTLPNGQKYLHWIEEDEATLHQAILDLVEDLKDWTDLDFNPERSQQMYDRLIHPFEAILEQAPAIDTLLFVHDSLFRSIPMAALYSGHEYLIERYAIATAPFLSLSNLEPADNSKLKVLFVGVTRSVSVNGNTLPALDFVATEAANVKNQLPNTTLLLDSDRDSSQLPIKEALKAALQSTPYSALHIATHGKFEADAEKSFLVLGSESVITLSELDALVREFSPNTEPLELIVLSACQTATGYERATLGLAGVTIRAGAKSALATLWSVSDATTATLIEAFYQGMVEAKLPKAKALQQAQKRIIADIGREQSPGKWAPFTLIGNWQ